MFFLEVGERFRLEGEILKGESVEIMIYREDGMWKEGFSGLKSKVWGGYFDVCVWK